MKVVWKGRESGMEKSCFGVLTVKEENEETGEHVDDEEDEDEEKRAVMKTRTRKNKDN